VPGSELGAAFGERVGSDISGRHGSTRTTAGQRVAVELTNSTIANTPVYIYDPNGLELQYAGWKPHCQSVRRAARHELPDERPGGPPVTASVSAVGQRIALQFTNLTNPLNNAYVTTLTDRR
jgi:hypothetical protein